MLNTDTIWTAVISLISFCVRIKQCKVTHMITSYHPWSFGIIWAPRELRFDFNWSGESDRDRGVLPSLRITGLFHDSAARSTCHLFGQKLSCFALINKCASSGFPVGFRLFLFFFCSVKIKQTPVFECTEDKRVFNFFGGRQAFNFKFVICAS